MVAEVAAAVGHLAVGRARPVRGGPGRGGMPGLGNALMRRGLLSSRGVPVHDIARAGVVPPGTHCSRSRPGTARSGYTLELAAARRVRRLAAARDRVGSKKKNTAPKDRRAVQGVRLGCGVPARAVAEMSEVLDLTR